MIPTSVRFRKVRKSSQIGALVCALILAVAYATAQPSEAWPLELDAVRAAPDSHKVLFENSLVRVLEVRIAPGTKEPMHHHRWPSLFLSLESGGVSEGWRYFDKNGKVTQEQPRSVTPVRKTPAWSVSWMEPEGLHALENLEPPALARQRAPQPGMIRVEIKTRP